MHFSGQYICSCPEGLQYNHRDGVCEWPNARECCERSEDEGGLAHRPCDTYASCKVNSDAGYCDRYDFDDEDDRFVGFLEDKNSCEFFYKVCLQISYIVRFFKFFYDFNHENPSLS